MHFIITVLIFIVIFTLYLHLISHYRKSEDLEIYEMDYIHNKGLNDICEKKQPVLFQMRDVYPDFFETMIFRNKLGHTENEVRVKDTDDYVTNPEDIGYIEIKMQTALQLMETDTKSHYITENNATYIEDSKDLYNEFYEMDKYIKPMFVANTKYDVLSGSKGANTPMRYHTNYRQFMAVTNGKLRVKMTCWKSSKYLYPIKDYSEYEFKSRINVWNPQSKFINDYHKIRFIEFDVEPGYVLHIPPYWWWSFKYVEENTSVCGFMYNTPLNIVSNAGDWMKYYIQQFNTEKKLLPTLKNSNHSSSNESSTEIKILQLENGLNTSTQVNALLNATTTANHHFTNPTTSEKDTYDSIEVSIDGKVI